MFITGEGWYAPDGTQKAKGKFLMVIEDPNPGKKRAELRACVRTVTLEQLGHWMMGQADLAGQRITLSGSYGSDGLPITLRHKEFNEDMAKHVWENLVRIPEDLQTAFWEGGGHNCAGAEAPRMKEWALANLKELHKPISKLKEGSHDDRDGTSKKA